MPARHTSPQDDLLLGADLHRRLWSTKEGVGETSGQTAGSLSKSSLFQNGPAEETSFFVRCGSLVRNFTGAQIPNVKSDPDVFADALVPWPGAADAGPLGYPRKTIVLTARGLEAGACRVDRGWCPATADRPPSAAMCRARQARPHYNG